MPESGSAEVGAVLLAGGSDDVGGELLAGGSVLVGAAVSEEVEDAALKLAASEAVALDVGSTDVGGAAEEVARSDVLAGADADAVSVGEADAEEPVSDALEAASVAEEVRVALSVGEVVSTVVDGKSPLLTPRRSASLFGKRRSLKRSRRC